MNLPSANGQKTLVYVMSFVASTFCSARAVAGPQMPSVGQSWDPLLGSRNHLCSASTEGGPIGGDGKGARVLFGRGAWEMGGRGAWEMGGARCEVLGRWGGAGGGDGAFLTKTTSNAVLPLLIGDPRVLFR